MLHCVELALQLCCPFDASDARCLFFHIIFTEHSIITLYTGCHSVSVVLLWQPSDCIDLIVVDYIFALFLENEYDGMQVSRCTDVHYSYLRVYRTQTPTKLSASYCVCRRTR